MVLAHAKSFSTAIASALESFEPLNKITVISVVVSILLAGETNGTDSICVTEVCLLHDVQVGDVTTAFRFRTEDIIFVCVGCMWFLWRACIVFPLHMRTNEAI